MREPVLKLIKKGNKQYKSSYFFINGNCVGVNCPISIHNTVFLQKSFYQMVAAMCHALPSFYSNILKNNY